MKILDLSALADATVAHDPCDHVVVPCFVRREWLSDVNRDYPEISEPGNFDPAGLRYGPAFETLLDELHSDELRRAYAAKFGMDLDPFPLQMTVRRFSEASDGHIHNDSKGKIVTSLIYFNEAWEHEAGKLRLLRSQKDIDDYAAEVTPELGTMIAFRRSESSFHGFHPCEAERRSLQMYWVKPKREERGEKQVTLKRRAKRLWNRLRELL